MPSPLKSKSPRRPKSKAPVTSTSLPFTSRAPNELYKDVSSIPPRVLNSFFLWKKHRTELMLTGQAPTLSTSKEWSLAWWGLPQSDRDQWQKRFREENAAFLAANPGYSYGAVKGLKKKAREENQRQKRKNQRNGNEGSGREQAMMFGMERFRLQNQTPTSPCSVKDGASAPNFMLEKGEAKPMGSQELPTTSPEASSCNAAELQRTDLKTCSELSDRQKRRLPLILADIPPEITRPIAPRLVRNTSLVNWPNQTGLRPTAKGEELWFTRSPIDLSPTNSLISSRCLRRNSSLLEPCMSPFSAMFQEQLGDFL